ncbi:MAG: acyl-CoA thioester hydrolase [Nocardioidaceae bacterium]|jgi:acyl-CoA thioester hydrolase|nr:acyl-CoA thioester hydrolase [Nocardioidaceae bacterium]
MRSWSTCCCCWRVIGCAMGDGPMGAGAVGDGAAPFSAYRTMVRPEWLDYNGHMHDASYAIALSEANEELFAVLDLSEEYRKATHASLYTIECFIRFLAESSLGQTLTATTMLVGAERKLVRLFTELWRDDGQLAATGEFLYLHVDTLSGATSEIPQPQLAGLRRMLSMHSTLARPDQLGRGVGAARDRVAG